MGMLFVIFGNPLLLTLQVLEDQTNQIKAKIENMSQELKSYNENKQELIDHMTEKLKSLKIEKENHEKVKIKFKVTLFSIYQEESITIKFILAIQKPSWKSD